MPDQSGKAIDLRVRPLQSVDLCFPASGVIGYLPDNLLGQTTKAADVAKTIYPLLSQTKQTDESQLVWNAAAIQNSLAPNILASLRAESLKVDLDSAIGTRQNAYYTMYQPAVVALMVKTFTDNPAAPGNVISQLVSDLQDDTGKLQAGLQTAYQVNGILDEILVGATSTSNFENRTVAKQANPGSPSATELDSGATTTGHSTTSSEGYEYRNPSLENTMRYRRAMISLQQEFVNAFRMSQMCGHPITFQNELAGIDLQIKKLQVSFLDAFLLSPFDGVVTGVFQSEGDYVTGGEPVIRVENDASVYLVGTIKFRGLLRVNNNVSVSTALFDTAGTPSPIISGTVAAVRGHDSIADQWDVLIRCSNRTASGDAILPLNYNFDFESTIVNVSAI